MEEVAKKITLCISHGLEIVAAAVIAMGLVKLIVYYFYTLLKEKNTASAIEPRVRFGSAVAVALELLLGADVLATAVAPSWDDIGQLAAIAVIRTTLNYFLGKELKEIKTVSGG